MQFKEKLGISITQKYGGVMETFRKYGIHYMEFRAVHGDDPELIKSYVDIALSEKEKYGMMTPTVHLPHKVGFDLSALDEQDRRGAIEKQKMIYEILSPLKPQIAVIHPSVGDVAPEDIPARTEAIIRSLKELAPWFKERGVKIALENLTQKTLSQRSEVLKTIVEAVGDNIGICFDVNHLFFETHTEFIHNVGKYIITMHVSDNDGLVERHFLPGDGVINWKEVFEELDKIGYDSTMILECGQILSDFPNSLPTLIEKWNAIHN